MAVLGYLFLSAIFLFISVALLLEDYCKVNIGGQKPKPWITLAIWALIILFWFWWAGLSPFTITTNQ